MHFFKLEMPEIITIYLRLLCMKPGDWPWAEDTDYGFEISDFHGENSNCSLPEALRNVTLWGLTDISDKFAETFSSIFIKCRNFFADDSGSEV
jgi:hypothetical protein